MIQENFGQNQQLNKIFKDSQFQEIIKAIILGKYAWACVLFLHFSGCDPLDYMPSETYDKLVQENNIFNEHHQSLMTENTLKVSALKFSWLKLISSKDSRN